MDKPYLLHFITPGKNASPFDVNMAYDAGWSAVVPYTGVTLEEVGGLVQDAIFSRSQDALPRTGLFLGGRDIETAADMMEVARSAMFPPFQISVLADPSGAYTTAAALLAKVEKHLRGIDGAGLEGRRVLIFGGTGPVGSSAGILAARSGAGSVLLIGRERDAAVDLAQRLNRRFGLSLDGASADDDASKRALLGDADVVLATAKAGVQVLSGALLAAATRLKLAADINAVPPPGIEGIDPKHDGVALTGTPSGALAVGALAVGSLKYKVERSLLRHMRESERAEYLDLEQAFDAGRRELGD